MTRREAREQAFVFIFQAGFGDSSAQNIIDNNVMSDGITVDPYAEKLLKNTLDNLDDIDKTVDEFSDKWKLDRLPKVSLSILRLAICELKYIQDVPVGAVINEAVELAKKYAGEDDAAYINGVLGGYYRSLSDTSDGE